MVWAIVVVAIAVLGVAAWAGTGRLGEMPETVTDRPKAHIPDGPVDQEFLASVSLPVASTGYRRSQVDYVLASYVAGAALESDQRFDVVRRGYDMQAVDLILDRMRPAPTQPTGEDVGVLEDAPGDPHQDFVTALSAVADDRRAATTLEVGDVETLPAATPGTQDSLHQEGVEEGGRGEAAAP